MLERYMGFKKEAFYTKKFFDEDLDTFEKIQKTYAKGYFIDEKMKKICEICEELNHPEYTLIISSHLEKEKQVEVIVWNIYEGEARFCATVNKVEGSRIRLGIIETT